MAAFNKYNCFARDLCKGIHNLSTHAFKFRLTTATPSAAHTAVADVTTIATGNGWSTDGSLTIANATLDGSTYRVTFSDATVEAAGGAIAEFRYVVVYNSNDATGHLVGYFDYGTWVNLSAGEKLTLDFDSTTGVITVA